MGGIFGGGAEPGDMVRATRTIPVTLTDHLAGGGISPGTRGVILERTGRRLQVRFDAGFGTVAVRTDTAAVRVTRRGVGAENFTRRTTMMTTVRLAIAAFLLFPIAWFCFQYVVQTGGFDGIIPAFATAAVDSAIEWVGLAIAHPLQTLIYGVFLAVLSRIAFR